MKFVLCIVVFLAATTLALAQVEEEDIQTLCICGRIYQPLCASNGVTYANPCEFDCVLKRKRNLRVIKAGRCEEE
ncbi:hypothetical protein Trydic_g13954 [Trypoxylus dichotomus]